MPYSRMMLNNYLQARYGITRLTWNATHVGPEDAGEWVVIAYFDDIECGRGTAKMRSQAYEEASRQALTALGYD